jgi:excisionase family DNA binding protein
MEAVFLASGATSSHAVRQAALEAESFINETGAEGLALLRVGTRRRPLSLPKELAQAISALCLHFAVGHAVAAYNDDLTTSQAAKLLGISRTRLVFLINRGDLPCHFKGDSHRRLRLEDVLVCLHRREAQSFQPRRAQRLQPRPESSPRPRKPASMPRGAMTVDLPKGAFGQVAIPHGRLGDPR